MNPGYLLSESSKVTYNRYLGNLPQALILVAPSGAGKSSLLHWFAKDFLGEKYFQYLSIIEPEKDKKQIGIAQIKEAKRLLILKNNHPRIILIPQANKLSVEAQNNLLKVLEEPPAKTHFILATSSISHILQTVRSRSAIWQLIPPTNSQIANHFSAHDPATLQKATSISGGQMGILASILKNDTSHPLVKSLEIAKQILSQTELEKLANIKTIGASAEKCLEFLEALEILCHATLESVAKNSPNLKQVKAWQGRLKYTNQAIGQLGCNVQPKLVLTKLFLVI
jgi:DNA polymerase III delta prime subunit